MKNANKALRHEKKMLKYKKRLKNYGLKESDTSNLHAFRSHGKPCSCIFCQPNKVISPKTERQKAKLAITMEIKMTA